MSLGNVQKQVAQQRLQQRLTPLQVQFVRMLEMSDAEMQDEVARALEEMPALEAVPSDGAAADDAAFAGRDAADDGRDEAYWARGYVARDFGGRRDGIADRAVSPDEPTLIEHLETQLAQHEGVTPGERLIGRYVIGNIDSNGYLTRSLQAIADDVTIAEGHEVTAADVARVVDIIKEFDPAGVGASSLKECLELQLGRARRDVATVTALKIVRDHFDLFSKKHFDRIANILGISAENMRQAIAVVSRLNPKPGAAFAAGDSDITSHVEPDFEVSADDRGEVVLTMPNSIPELRIEQSFAEDTPLPEATARNAAQARLFIRQSRADAQSFIRVVEMRRQTLYRVMAAIVRLQHRFFVTGEESDIRPMVLRDVAALTGYDLSVISRATQQKYVATPTGIYPLKFFFNEPSGTPGSETTHHRLVAEIRSLVDQEDKNAPLTDDALTARLAAMGLDVARRTVAKYRERMGIPVARLRRQSI